MKFETVFTDVLVIGSGVAGLRAAVACAENGVKAAVVSKGPSASPEIMGFNAPVLPGDSTELYFEDVEKSGYGINDSRMANLLSERVLGEVAWLEENGVEFDKDENGQYLPIHTLGTKFARLIRSGTSTGVTEMKMLRAKCDKAGIEIHLPSDVLGLLKADGKVIGAYALEDGKLVRYIAKATVLATGGCGAIQSFSTYPKAIIGDGYAMAYEAGATLVDMEIQQFEPCCFICPEKIRGKVIATTLLRHGGELRNGKGETFMENYGLTRDNAQKGSLSRAMLSEVRAGRGTPHGGIYYDMTMFDKDFLYVDHAIFTKPAVAVGMDLTKEMPEMMPAAHTNIGGVIINDKAETEVKGLFACGEVIGGLHGGNRLGGCAGAETVVFGHIAGDGASAFAKENTDVTQKEIDEATAQAEKTLDSLLSRKGENKSAYIKETLGLCLTENLGITRNAETIDTAEKEVERLQKMLDESGCETLSDAADAIHCDHMLKLAMMQIKASEMRKESRGVYFREDYPETSDEWNKNILIRENYGGEMMFTTRDAVRKRTF